jgi:predicted MPP superfamily phosphohydrolase
MKFKRINRRRFLLTALLATPLAAFGDARWMEPNWVKVRRLSLTANKPSHRFVHFSDLHHKGEGDYAQKVVEIINSLKPDFVCFTGDLVEDKKFLTEALKILSGIKAPLYGVPGNHDYWSRAPFNEIAAFFAATGGAWLLDEQRTIAQDKVNLIGLHCLYSSPALQPVKPGMKNILLMHYPAWVKKLNGQKFDLLLAGHSHGGQVRIPFYGSVLVPFGVDEFDMGLFQTASGPFYVNPGIGWFPVRVRFNCRPEITLIEI